MLSHYTDIHGLKGITESQSVRATDFLALNDSSEMVFAMEAIFRAAATEVLKKIPADIRDKNKSDDHLFSQFPEYLRQIKEMLRGNDYETLYITSFARGKTAEENNRGILTLWDRYTETRGYCLQFDIEKIRRLLESERTYNNYAMLELAEVNYGIDKNSPEFREIVEQVALLLQIGLAKAYNDPRLEPDMSRKKAEPYVVRKFLGFCALHKDPSFADEREIRIFAFVHPATQPRIFTGLARAKMIHRKPSGARFIFIGEHIRPGLIPARIIVGPNAEKSIADIQPFAPSAQVYKSDIPIVKDCLSKSG